MRNKIQIWKVITVLGIMLFLSDRVLADEWALDSLPGKKVPAEEVVAGVDSFCYSRHFIHRIGLEARPGYIMPTNPFLRYQNYDGKRINQTLSTHLRYSFQFSPNSYADRIYGAPYQGLGVARFDFYSEELGTPTAIYMFQGARLAQFTSRLSLNYEWDFGLSFGWNPYDGSFNTNNKVIGSKANAYINTNFYLNWMFSRHFDLVAGVELTHFSNGNTKFPNAGLNTAGVKVGLVYNINRKDDAFTKPNYLSPIPKFPHHVSYDLVLFGSWRRKGVDYQDHQVPAPDAYTVLGFNFAPMYNVGYRCRLGMSLDGVYDGSANVTTEYYSGGDSDEFRTPSLAKQLALGVSARAEYVMPYFTVGIGLGTNVVHAGGDHKGFYQVLALKIEMTRSTFLHIGYNLKDFHDPNYLMLGFGFRFNNRYPAYHR